MNEDIQKELLIISKEVQDAGRKIGSTKIDIDDLQTLADALELHRKTLLIYIKMEKARMLE